MATVDAAAESSRLLDLAQLRDWEGCRQLVKVNPSESSAVDADSGYTALHHAAIGGASTSTVKALLDTAAGRRAALVRCREGGWTPLHLSCRSIATDDTILCIALSNPDSIAVQDEEGDTGLHSALRYGASELVLQTLIHLTSSSSHHRDDGTATTTIQTCDLADGDLPLHSAIRHEASASIIELLLDACPHSVTARNCEWKTPLHLACELGRHDAVAVLIDSMKDFMGVQVQGFVKYICLEDWHGNTPIGALWKKYLDSVRDTCLDHHTTYDQLGFLESAEQIEIWDSIVLLVTSAHFRGKQQVDCDPRCRSRSQVHLLIQAVIGLGCACPPSLLRFLVRRYPLVLSTPNASGRLPLHEAILVDLPSSHHRVEALEKRDVADASLSEHDNNVCDQEQGAPSTIDSNLIIEGLKEQHEISRDEEACPSDVASSIKSATSEAPSSSSSALQVLLDAYPQGATAQDVDGRLPLHLAALSCLSWKDGTERIFQAAPEALGVQDGKTGLLPFMLAATAAKAGANEEEDESTTAVDNIYRLLRNGPELVASGRARQPPLQEKKKSPQSKKRKGASSGSHKKRKSVTAT